MKYYYEVNLFFKRKQFELNLMEATTLRLNFNSIIRYTLMK